MRTETFSDRPESTAFWREAVSLCFGLFSFIISTFLAFESLFRTLATQAPFPFTDGLTSQLHTLLIVTVIFAALSPWLAQHIAKSRHYLTLQSAVAVFLLTAFFSSGARGSLYADPESLFISLTLAGLFSTLMVMTGYMLLLRLIVRGKLKARFLRGPEPQLFGPHQRFG